MRAIDAEQMANDEDIAYHNACKKITDEVNTGVNYVVHYKIQRLIADTPELPTMQSDNACAYCSDMNCNLRNSGVNGCILFKGKKVIEVE